MSSIATDTCVYYGCQNTKKRSANVRFYKFPIKNKTRCEKWVLNSGNTKLKLLDTELLKSRLICEMHFTVDSFRDPTAPNKLLTRNAVPVKCSRGCADEEQVSLIVPASPEKTIDNSASSSGGHQPEKTHARKRPTSSADLRTSPLNANIKAKRSQSICRTCLRTSDVEENPFYQINSTTSDSNWPSTIKQQFAACVPEVDFEITADAHICGYCATALQVAYEFRKNCLKTEETICNFVREAGGDIYNVNLEKLLSWINSKTIQKLQSVEILSDITRSDKGAEEICINNDSDISLSTVTDELEIKEEPLLDEHDMLKIVKVEGEGGQCDIKLEETEVVQEPVFVDVGKLNEDDEHGMESITKIHEVTTENPPIINVENLHTCQICQTDFSLKRDLRLHLMFHANNTHECDVCEVMVNDLDDHDVQTCMKNKLCGASAAKKSKLEEVVKSNYQCDNSVGSTPLICEEINKIDMKYMCNVCRESFTEKVHLIQHLNSCSAGMYLLH